MISRELLSCRVFTSQAIAECERLEQEVALFTEGMVSLSNELPSDFTLGSEQVKYGEENGKGQPDKAVNLLALLEEKLANLAEAVQVIALVQYCSPHV